LPTLAATCIAAICGLAIGFVGFPAPAGAQERPVRIVALGDSLTTGLGLPDTADGVIVALGANDMLRGIDPAVTQKALDEILRRLTERRIPVLLAGMRAAPNLGADFGKRFEAIYPELAAKYAVLLYPFLLDGVATDAKLNQRDGIHPSAAGVDRMVAGILPKVEELVARIRQRSPP
jgi:acyl-CoA thioesterase-1